MTDDRDIRYGHKGRLRDALKRLALTMLGHADKKDAGVAPDPDSEPARWSLRKLYDDIGLFLFSHRLDLTPLNFGCAHDYVIGSHRRIVDDVDRAIQERRLSNGWVEEYLAVQDSHVVMPDALADTTAQLAEELDGCLDQLGQSTERQERYSTALDETVRTASPDGLLMHLRDLTKQMVEQNKLAEIEMRLSHRRVSELRATLRSARQASKQDRLTGLQNRRGFERIVETWQGSPGGVGGVLAICDIDHFKTVNDRFGHDTGDRVLRYVADALQALAEMGHEVARLGGEEFVILMPDRTIERAASEVNLIRESLDARHLIDRETKLPIGPVTFSAGLTVLRKTDTLAPALRRADAALYAAKRAGRNRIHAAVDNERILPFRGIPGLRCGAGT